MRKYLFAIIDSIMLLCLLCGIVIYLDNGTDLSNYTIGLMWYVIPPVIYIMTGIYYGKSSLYTGGSVVISAIIYGGIYFIGYRLSMEYVNILISIPYIVMVFFITLFGEVFGGKLSGFTFEKLFKKIKRYVIMRGKEYLKENNDNDDG